MKKLLEGQSAVLIFLLGLALYFVLAGLGYGRNSRVFPVSVGIFTAILILVDLASQWAPALFPRAGMPAAEAVGVGYSGAAVVRMVIWLVAGVLGVGLVGFGIAVPLFVALFGRVEGRVGWVACAAVGAFFLLFVFGYFEFFMGIRMFRGIIFGDLLPLL